MERAHEVERFGTPELDELLRDMHDTMEALNGAGLAAPQIAVPLRVVVFGLKSNPRYPDAEAVPYTVLINPVITPLGEDKEEGWEGCLSVPGMRGLVPRWRALHYRGYDAQGERDRSNRERIPRARRAARVRSPGRDPLPVADSGLAQLRVP